MDHSLIVFHIGVFFLIFKWTKSWPKVDSIFLRKKETTLNWGRVENFSIIQHDIRVDRNKRKTINYVQIKKFKYGK